MNNAENIMILSAFGDNYIYLFEYSPGQCFVVDPGDAKPVFKVIEGQQLQLTHILITHHHADHIGGVRALTQQFDCEVIGPDDKRIGKPDTVMNDNDMIELGDVKIRCIYTPGHTTSSVCYYVTGNSLTQPVLFTGDTLFVCGCGRMFECGGETMYASLQKLTTLPEDTLVYPGHDYTEENIRFSLMCEPNHKELKDKLTQIQKQAKSGLTTVPSILAEEKQLNLFLRAKDWQTFTELRQRKNVF